MPQLLAPPGRAPHRLESLAVTCLRADPDDTRLGDLSEQYVRTHELMRMRLGSAPWAMAASHLAADLRYLAAAANVMLFARAVDPGLCLTENGVAALVALDLRERTMAVLRVAVRKVVLPALVLMCSALLINTAVDGWYTWQQTESLMARVQREKAEGAAQRIEAFAGEIQRQIAWVAYAKFETLPVEQRRFDYVRLLRQTPAITQLAQLDLEGHEQLNVSRLSMDVVGRDIDRSAEPAFVQAKENRVYWGPLYFRKASEPYATLAIAHGGRTGVTVAEINLKLVWDVVKSIKVGEGGYAYIVDGKGRLIAYRDESMVLRGHDLAALPQVAAALADASSGEPFEGRTFDPGASATSVLSVHTAVPTLGWQVFVELPVAEIRAPLWAAVIRGASLLGLGLVVALLAILLAARPMRLSRLTPA